MTKQPKRQLAGSTLPAPPRGPACLACTFRKGSNLLLRSYEEAGKIPPSFSGHLFVGTQDGLGRPLVVINQYSAARQQAMLTVPLESLEMFIAELERTAESYLASLAENTPVDAPEDPAEPVGAEAGWDREVDAE